MIGIYKITSPSKRIYIGQSINIEKRFKHYKRLSCKKQVILYSSFLKYGVDKHKFEILCECEISELNDKERYYQDLYSVITKNGLNCILTKSSDRSGNISELTKIKMCLGRLTVAPKSIEARKKHSESLKKNKDNNLRLLENNERKKIKIGVFDFNTDEKISEFNSMRECARIMNIDRKSISWSCKNIYPYAYGFKFKYL